MLDKKERSLETVYRCRQNIATRFVSPDIPSVSPQHLRHQFTDEKSFLFTGYQIEWEGKWIYVFRPDVECTNGIIHVIDKVFMKDSDVRVTGTASITSLAPHLIMILVAKWLL